MRFHGSSTRFVYHMDYFEEMEKSLSLVTRNNATVIMLTLKIFIFVFNFSWNIGIPPIRTQKL